MKKALNKAFKKISKVKDTTIAFCSSVAASVTARNDLPFNWEDIDRIVNATKSHSISGFEYVNKLPGELERFGSAAVEAYVKGGDNWQALVPYWCQKNSPELADDASNAILEDDVNVTRGARDMTIERG